MKSLLEAKGFLKMDPFLVSSSPQLCVLQNIMTYLVLKGVSSQIFCDFYLYHIFYSGSIWTYDLDFLSHISHKHENSQVDKTSKFRFYP